MTHGSLFSGIGGFDLAAEWMGWENKFHCEWNEFGQKVLHHYWPNAEQFTDITKTDFTKYANSIDIISGGFPCQPYSLAGKRKGKEDERHLWPEMLRAIREIRPRWVVGENVFGLINWSGGLVFHEVQADLEAEGYEVFPYVLPACSVNAPHRRDRVWFVAKNTKCNGCVQRESDKEGTEVWQQRNTCTGSSDGVYLSERVTPNSDNSGTNINMQLEREWTENNINRGFSQSEFRQNDGNGDAADTESEQGKRMRPEQREFSEQEQREFGGRSSKVGNGRDAADTESQRHKSLNQGGATIIPTPEGSSLYGRGGYSFHEPPNWENFPTQSPVCNGDDGLSERLDSITFPKWRNESIKAGGNAIVPQVALQIFKAIEQYENLTKR